MPRHLPALQYHTWYAVPILLTTHYSTTDIRGFLSIPWNFVEEECLEFILANTDTLVQRRNEVPPCPGAGGRAGGRARARWGGSASGCGRVKGRCQTRIGLVPSALVLVVGRRPMGLPGALHCLSSGHGMGQCGGGGGAAWAAKTVERPPQQPAQPPARQLLGTANAQTAPAATGTAPAHQTTGLRERGNDTGRSTGRSGRQNAATRRNMRREERVTVQGPVPEFLPGGGGAQTGQGTRYAPHHPLLHNTLSPQVSLRQCACAVRVSHTHSHRPPPPSPSLKSCASECAVRGGGVERGTSTEGPTCTSAEPTFNGVYPPQPLES